VDARRSARTPAPLTWSGRPRAVRRACLAIASRAESGVAISCNARASSTWWRAPTGAPHREGLVRALVVELAIAFPWRLGGPIAVFRRAASRPPARRNTGAPRRSRSIPAAVLLAAGGQDRVGVRGIVRRLLRAIAALRADRRHHFVACCACGDRVVAAGNDGAVLQLAGHRRTVDLRRRCFPGQAHRRDQVGWRCRSTAAGLAAAGARRPRDATSGSPPGRLRARVGGRPPALASRSTPVGIQAITRNRRRRPRDLGSVATVIDHAPYRRAGPSRIASRSALDDARFVDQPLGRTGSRILTGCSRTRRPIAAAGVTGAATRCGAALIVLEGSLCDRSLGLRLSRRNVALARNRRGGRRRLRGLARSRPASTICRARGAMWVHRSGAW